MSASQTPESEKLKLNTGKQIKNSRNQTINMFETQYSLTASNNEPASVETSKNKMTSFKKIKAGYLHQKNNSGKAIKQIRETNLNIGNVNFSPSSLSQQCVNTHISNLVERLDDAATIYSQQSNRQVESEFSQHIQIDADDSFEFLSRGIVLSPLKKCAHERQMSLNPSYQQLPLSPTRKYYTLPNEEASQYHCEDNKEENYNWFFNEVTNMQMRVIKNDPNLVISQDIGALFNFQFYHFKSAQSLKFANLISMKKIKGVLDVHGAFSSKNLKLAYPLNSFCFPIASKKQYIVLYQPFIETFTESLLKSAVVSYSQFCRFLLEIISILLQLGQNKIFIQVDPFNVININGTIKIKIKFDEPSNGKKTEEKDVIRSLGAYLNTHFKLLYHRQGKNLISKIQGIDLFKRVEVKQFIDDITKEKMSSLEVIYQRAKKILSF